MACSHLLNHVNHEAKHSQLQAGSNKNHEENNEKNPEA